MKKLLILFTLLYISSSCNDDDNTSANPIDQLPPATQVGANTFGCLLDGQVFKPGNGANPLDCNYQLVDGEYYFTLRANKDSNQNFRSINLLTRKLQIFQGQTYSLIEETDGNAFGVYFIGDYALGTSNFYYTSSINSGELKITKLDNTNNIVSGTFWYDVQDNNGVIHQIRDGRFDMQFTE